MKVIQTMNDIEYMKASSLFPTSLLTIVERDFLLFYEAEGNDEEVTEFQLPNHQALLIAENEEDVHEVTRNPLDIEYIEQEQQHFKIGKRNDQEIQFVYVPFYILGESLKESLQNQSEYE